MKNLTIDEGNTSTKLAFFNNDSLIFKEADVSFDRTKELLNKAEHIILSTVKRESMYLKLVKRRGSILLNHSTPIPIFNKYKKLESLGNDRLALMVGASYTFPKSNVLVIDAGTCITYDFLNEQQEYLGGSISPGLQMRLKALNQFTDQLPLLNSITSTTLIGSSTEESICSGVLNGLCCEIDGIIKRYRKKYPSINIIITGGDVKLFDKELKNSIFAAPDLLMEGLNRILQYNEPNI